MVVCDSIALASVQGSYLPQRRDCRRLRIVDCLQEPQTHPRDAKARLSTDETATGRQKPTAARKQGGAKFLVGTTRNFWGTVVLSNDSCGCALLPRLECKISVVDGDPSQTSCWKPGTGRFKKASLHHKPQVYVRQARTYQTFLAPCKVAA